jgi:hypothetical protein
MSMAMAVTMLGAASGPASAAVRFGSLLTTSTAQPTSERSCAQAVQCTWVMNAALHRTTATAPMNGTVHHVRVISLKPGHMKLFVARINASLQAKVIFKGPKLTLAGQPDPDPDPTHYVIETFSVSIPVSTGDSIAFRAVSTSAMNCTQGSPHTLEFQPALTVGGPFTTRQDDNGCFELVEFQY